MDVKYEIRVQGLMGPLLRAAFADLHCRTVARQATIRGRLSADQLRTLLTRLDRSGVELIGLRCQRSPSADEAGGRAPDQDRYGRTRPHSSDRS